MLVELSHKEFEIDGHSTLNSRPFLGLVKALKQFGVKFNFLAQNSNFPFKIHGGGIISTTNIETPSIPFQRKESIEDLAMLSGGSVQTMTGFATGNCSACGASNPPAERYCQSCGATLSA